LAAPRPRPTEPVSAERHRLDQALVERGLAPSRAQAQAIIKAGHVRVGSRVSRKPAELVLDSDKVLVEGAQAQYVSRGALKLKHALEHFTIDPRGLICVDIGASTGGFSQILLEGKARKIYAIDVGHGQLAQTIADDPRVVPLEKLNVKDVSAAHVADAIDLVVCDVSFIGLAKALPAALALCAPGALLVALIKPQFEVGRAHIGKGGIVRDEKEQRRVCAEIETWLNSQPGWEVQGIIESPIAGGDGNREFLLAARKSGGI